jgi:hypothetical protein
MHDEVDNLAILDGSVIANLLQMAPLRAEVEHEALSSLLTHLALVDTASALSHSTAYQYPVR